MSRVGPLNATAIGRLGALADHSGYLQVNGPLRIPLSNGSETATTISNLKVDFPQHGERDITSITIGLVHSGTTVAQLIHDYPTLSDLLSAMFNILPEPTLSPNNASFGFYFPSAEFEAGTTANIITILRLDRGEWQPEQTNGGAIPYGPVTHASFEHPVTSANINMNVPPTPQSRVVQMTHALWFTFPHTMTVYYANTASATTSLGEPAYNSRMEGVQMPEREWFITQPVPLRTFRYVWRNGEGVTLNNSGADPIASNQASSPKLYADTSSIVVSQQTTEDIYIPEREPQTLAVYVKPIFEAWVDQPLTSVWQKRYDDGYWIVRLGNQNRDKVDIRITF